ncbi:hypothetical protein [Halegenticoccus tardaugens]|uniref:hypothetical protein n=1 Tax=Halegenticoccus tardaugens TaxID=2071624 RepID=UPI00100BFFFE|nr:hypothetical protein [Halegenticoccus tardaugens]
MPSPPAVPDDRLAGWRRIERSTDTPFDVGFFRITAHTVVYEDADLRAAIGERAGTDRTWRIFLASRLVLSPPLPLSPPLSRLIADRAAEGFADRLRDRGFVGVAETETGSLDIDGERARLTGYEATCQSGGVTLAVEGWIARWRSDGQFLLAGGAYPTAVRGAADDGTAAAVRETLRPEAFRDELFELIRATG